MVVDPRHAADAGAAVSPTDADARRPRVLIVVGAGRSGTSTLTRGLQALGADLGDRLKPPGHKNAKGFFEDRDILEINYRLHDLLGLQRNGASLRLLPDTVWQQADVQRLAAEAADRLESRFGAAPLWGFKCIGVMRLLPFWEQVLAAMPSQPRIGYVVAIRNPLSVAGSREAIDYYRGFQEKCDLEWLVHTLPYLDRVLARDWAVVDYDALMQAPEAQLSRVARAHGLPLDAARRKGIEGFARDFVSAGLRHNTASLDDLAASERVNPLTRRCYLWLHALSAQRPRDVDSQRTAAQAQWRQQRDALDGMAPLLLHIDRLEDRLRKRLFGAGALWQTALQHLRQGRLPPLLPALGARLSRS